MFHLGGGHRVGCNLGRGHRTGCDLGRGHRVGRKLGRGHRVVRNGGRDDFTVTNRDGWRAQQVELGRGDWVGGSREGVAGCYGWHGGRC